MANFCTQCGAQTTPQQNFCTKCGHAFKTQPPSAQEHQSRPVDQSKSQRNRQQATSQRKTTQSVRRSKSNNIVLVILAIVYALLSLMAFVNDAGFGSKLNVVLVLIFSALAISFMRPIILFLKPWWAIQSRFPAFIRWGLTFGISFFIGFGLGTGAGGREWSATLISLTSGTVIGFLMLFRSAEIQRTRREKVVP